MNVNTGDGEEGGRKGQMGVGILEERKMVSSWSFEKTGRQQGICSIARQASQNYSAPLKASLQSLYLSLPW